MKYTTRTGTLSELATPCLVASLSEARKLARAADALKWFDAAIRDFTDQPGKVLLLALDGRSRIERLLIAGGADATVSETQYRKIVTTAARALKSVPVARAVWTLHATQVSDRDLAWRVSTGLAALASALYEFSEYKSGSTEPGLKLRTVQVHADARNRTTVQRAVADANALQAGMDLARDLGNQPPNVCNPGYLLRQARKLARNDRVKVSALDERRMRELGMGAFLAVSQGSDTPGRMIVIEYRGGRRGAAPVALVGKAITFDTGGISLKPPANMHEMKYDMCGGASVLGATLAAIEARLPINLVTIVAAAENMPSGKATRPGDIVTTHSGKTVEILNTDAEGRLVLCDALSYAVERFKPDVIIDVATLTGAIITALGIHASGMFSSDDRLAADLLEAGEWSGDRAWRMPIWDEYQEVLKSEHADLPNIAGPGASSITAACFLSRFVQGQRWAHLDVAGTALPNPTVKGATGRPVGLLFRYLCQHAGR
ncbi:MAG: leucyl aminopeptidase [Pseudomonadales bacterium]